MQGEALALDTVVDQNDEQWIGWSVGRRTGWFTIRELHTDPKEVYARLAAPGAALLTKSGKDRLADRIERLVPRRQALVAARPGWVGSSYVLGDGRVVQAGPSKRRVIVAFQPDRKAASRGTLEDWQQAIGEIVPFQSMLIFAMSFALVGPLLRFLEGEVINPVAEIVGPPERGKTILLVLAASVWGGDPTSDLGAAETMDATINAIDDERGEHADGFLALDELHLASADRRGLADFLGKLAFKAAATGHRKRWRGPDNERDTRLAMLFSGNASIGDLAGLHGDRDQALRSRVVSIHVGEHGVLRRTPEGFSTRGDAAVYLRRAVNRFYGTAGPAFVRGLVMDLHRDPVAFQQLVRTTFGRFQRRIAAVSPKGTSSRRQNVFALACTAGALAKRYGVFLPAWGTPHRGISHLFRALSTHPATPVAAIDRVRAYLHAHRRQIVDVAKLGAPLSVAAFKAHAGFLRRRGDGIDLLVPSHRFQMHFSDHRAIMAELRRQGLAQTEGGRAPKLTIKAPSRLVAGSGRVYCVKVK